MLTSVLDDLASIVFDIHSLNDRHKSIISVKYDLILLDLKEIINRHNCSGYLFTAYILQLAILKMSFLIELICKDDSPSARHCASVLYDSIKNLDDMLADCYDCSSEL
jgi:hypothetical protein